MKIKKSLVIALSTVMAISACSIGVFAFDKGETAHDHYSEVMNTLSKGEVPHIQFTDDEKEEMIRKRKADRMDMSDKTFEELLIERGREDILEEHNREMEKLRSDEEFLKREEENKQERMILENEANERENIAINLVQSSGYYPEGVDKKELERNEDYSLEFICNVCHAYSEHKGELSSGNDAKIVEYLNDCYDEITTWFPQSEKSMETYETIENTIKVRFYSTSVERR